MDMERQLFTKQMVIRVTGDNGEIEYPLIEKDDLQGKFDYRASVLPSIAGQQDVQKKQDMDLYQLLISLPFIDQRKLTAKVLNDWGWSLDSVAQSADQQAQQQGQGQPGQPGQGAPGAAPGGMPPMPPGGQPQDMGAMAAMAGGGQPPQSPPMGGGGMPPPQTKAISPAVIQQALAMMRKPGEEEGGQGPSGFAQGSMPINLLQGGQPPTAPAAGLAPPPTHGKTGSKNQRGHNRGGKVNTNIKKSPQNTNVESQLQNQALNIQR